VAGTSQFSQQAQQRLDNLERIERFRTAVGSDSSERKAEAKFLVAEHYLFNLDRPSARWTSTGPSRSRAPHPR